MSKIIYPVFWVLTFLTISFLIGQVTQSQMPWYQTLDKSPFNPPKVVFPIVWSTLYIILALVGHTLYKFSKSSQITKSVFYIFMVYMVVNWAWSFLFFAGHLLWFSFFWLLLSIALLIYLCFKTWALGYKVVAIALLPTITWSLYAAYLNGYIAIANP